MMLGLGGASEGVCNECKATAGQLGQSVQILISKCGHQCICSTCVTTVFALALQGLIKCPVCRIPLQQSDFSDKTPEDREMEYKRQTRKRVKEVYNRTEADFADLRSYNDYLEEVEELIYNLVYNIDKQATEGIISQYKQEHREEIVLNNRRREEEREAWRKRLRDEQKAKAERDERWANEEHKRKRDEDLEHSKRLVCSPRALDALVLCM
jgi:CDK-activating kinase assembly factor MAT1